MTCTPTHSKLLLGLVAATVLLLAASAEAVRTKNYSMEILVNGKPIREYAARGATYVEALEEAEYKIRLTNHTGETVAVALAVDGLNSIDAKTTSARMASKWVLGPYESVTVDGWQTSEKIARHFFFTTEERSYGAWLGKTANLGVIEAVVFRERIPRRLTFHDRSKASPGAGEGRAAGVPTRPAAPAARDQAACESGRSRELSNDMAATGIGREVSNPVKRVEFVCQDHAAAVVRVRYEYRPQLVALGVLPRPVDEVALERRESARGFDDMDFAPDPFAMP